MSVLASWLASPPPDAAIEIAPESVTIATLASRGGSRFIHKHAVEPMPVGALVPSLLGHNVIDRPAVLGAVRAALDRLGEKPRRVALVIPDPAARVALVHFDRVPARREDLDQLVRWQIKKTSPFPIDDAALSYFPGARGVDGSGEVVAVLARRDVVREYEALCDDAGIYAGLVDLATLSFANLYAAGSDAPPGDWLVVHVRHGYSSVAILRGSDLIFFRSRPDDVEQPLTDLVHQTAMYYQDRLAGQGFARVVVGGTGDAAMPIEAARQAVADRLGRDAVGVEASRVTGPERTGLSASLASALAPVAGMLVRAQREPVIA